jgi:uncharacterized membrane protein YjdF
MTEAFEKDLNPLPKALWFLWLAVVVVFLWSATRPHDYFTWMLEVLPAVIGAVILTAIYRRFRFTPLVYKIVSALTGSAGDAFLGTQGDVFDTQKDMALALVGAVTALITLSSLHDKQITKTALRSVFMEAAGTDDRKEKEER